MVALCRPGRADSGVANVAARTVANANNDADGWYKGNYSTSGCEFALARCHGPNGTRNMLT